MNSLLFIHLIVTTIQDAILVILITFLY